MSESKTTMFTIDVNGMLMGSDGTLRPMTDAEKEFLEMFAAKTAALEATRAARTAYVAAIKEQDNQLQGWRIRAEVAEKRIAELETNFTELTRKAEQVWKEDKKRIAEIEHQLAEAMAASKHNPNKSGCYCDRQKAIDPTCQALGECSHSLREETGLDDLDDQGDASWELDPNMGAQG